MDPFALQQEARKRTSRLVALAAVAVVATAVATGFVLLCASWGVWLAAGGVENGRVYDGKGVLILGDASDREDLAHFCDKNPEVPGICFAIALFVIIARWVYRYSTLSTGVAVMKELGAKQVHRGNLADDDRNASRLRFFNVCEEMSIASGLDMPSVWILEDVPGVNALAAGTDPSSAAVCVTRGAVDHLTRDELQGVVAHEFSHILNGDMQLNLRITSLIAGITAIARIGRGMLSVFESDTANSWIRLSGGSRRGGKSKDGGGAIILIYLGTAAALWLVGSIGAFFARLVQCAVSRQREFLADASAAQFTRNPEALARALRFASLADAVRGGRAFESWKGDVSHMLFSGSAERLLSTHPSSEERIRRLCPRGLPDDADVRGRVQRVVAERKRRGKEYERQLSEKVAQNRARKAAVAMSLADATLQPAALASVRAPDKAGETLIALLRGQAPEGWSGPLSASERRTLALRCVNTLRDGVTVAERRRWADEAERVVQEDGVYDSFEMMVTASVRRRLLSDGRPVSIVPSRTLLPVAARVIATVASFGGDPAGGYRAAEERLSLFGPGLPPMPEPYGDASEFLGALDSLVRLPPLAKRELLMGIKETVAQDGTVTDEEADYVAAVADAIGAYGWMNASL